MNLCGRQIRFCAYALLLCASTHAAPALPPALLELANALRATPMRCVPFEQRKHLASLDRELSFRGALSVTDDRRVHWQLTEPVQAEYQFLRDGAWRRTGSAPWARLAVPDAASRSIHDMLTALLDLDPVALTRQFDVRLTSETPLTFDAIPKNARLRQVIAKLTVQGRTRIERLRVQEAAGNWSEYRFAERAAATRCTTPAQPRL